MNKYNFFNFLFDKIFRFRRTKFRFVNDGHVSCWQLPRDGGGVIIIKRYGNDGYPEWIRYEFDKHGVLVSYADNDGYWTLDYDDSARIWNRKEYDARGRLISQESQKRKEYDKGRPTQELCDRYCLKGSFINRERYEYDESGGRTVYSTTDDGYWTITKYDKSGRKTYHENSLGVKIEYDIHGNETYRIESSGYWEKRKYDTFNQEVYYENSKGSIKRQRYSAYGKICADYYKDETGYWQKHEYNGFGKETFYENSFGFWRKREYDESGEETYYENSSGYWEKREYDESGKEAYYENSEGNWKKTSSGVKSDRTIARNAEQN